MYRDANLGLFCFPLTLGCIAAPFVICSQRESARTRVMTGSALLGIIVVAWLDFCKGGVIYRYTADLTLTASFLAAAVLLILLGNAMESEKAPAWVRWAVYAAVCAGFIFSFIAALRVSLINGHSYISDIPDNVLEFFEKILPFAQTVK